MRAPAPLPFTAAVATAFALGLGLFVAIGRAGDAKPAPASQSATAPVRELRIDMDKAVDLPLPDVKGDLKPEAFKTTDGRGGWVVRIPGNRPIATPAFAKVDGRAMLFVGGGYGSHEFYAFDAATGEKAWQMQTGDDGPSAAVVEDGLVAFNTESCTVIVADARTGKVVWQEWLGDPLMSQPAIRGGKLYMAHPAGQNKPNGQGQANVAAAAQPAPGQAHGSHRVLCADLRTGKHLWEQDITGDVISAPILAGDDVFLTCFDGTSLCLASADGSVKWKKANMGTSAPLVAGGQVVVAQREVRGGETFEGLRRMETAKGSDRDAGQLAQAKAAYLKPGATGNGGLATTQAAKLDASVGFASAPAAAALHAYGGAAANANVTSVAQAWAFQGSRAAFANGQIVNAQGNALNCLRASDGQVRWHGLAIGKQVGDGAQIFAPPAMGVKNLYVCSTQGHLLSVSQDEGRVGFVYATGQPISFQPALAGGNLYAGTNNGLLICLRTGDADADGWTAWGGNAQHNKAEGAK